MGREAWHAAVHGVAKSRTWLSEWTELETSWTVAHQAPLSMGFPRQKYWSELPFPSAGEPLNSGIKPWSLALRAGSLLTDLPGKPLICAAWWQFSVNLLHSRGFLETPTILRLKFSPRGWKTSLLRGLERARVMPAKPRMNAISHMWKSSQKVTLPKRDSCINKWAADEMMMLPKIPLGRLRFQCN